MEAVPSKGHHMPVISIITPTLNREAFLQALWSSIKAQTIQDFEWVVHDGSAAPSLFMEGLAAEDPRVRYIHDLKPMTVGMKRNALCAAASGEIILHFDDDDYYAPAFIEGMLTLMANSGADFVKLHGFFLHHRRSGMYAYWDLAHGFPLHHMLSDSEDVPVGSRINGKDVLWSYGFSFVYRRKVWEAIQFPDVNVGEDDAFAAAAVKAFNHAGMQDTDFLMLHVVHGGNTSSAYPQQLLPQAFGEAYFPGYEPVIESSAR